MRELGTRVEASKKRLESQLADMSGEQMKSYFQSFVDHPVIAELNKGGNDPQVKISNFLSLSESELDDVMKMQLIMQKDIQAGGSLMKEVATSGQGRGFMGDMHALRAMTAAGGGGGMMSGPPGSTGLGGHQHHPGCQHSLLSAESNKPPDVASGRGDVIER